MKPSSQLTKEWLQEQVSKDRADKDIASDVGLSTCALGYWRRKFGIAPRPASDRVRGGIRDRWPNGRRGPETAHWRGGRYETHSGYMRIWKPDHPHANPSGYVYEHRLVMEAKLGRLLLPGEVVDHIDCNPANNAPDNLRLHASRADHVRDHYRARLEMNVLRQRITDLEAENRWLRQQIVAKLEGWPSRADALA